MKLRDAWTEDKMLITAWSSSPSRKWRARLRGVRLIRSPSTCSMAPTAKTRRLPSVRAITVADKPAILRIPVGRNDLASRALDMGFEAVIAPMINSVADAEAFARAMKYPPMGERSWGPTRALQIHTDFTPESYFSAANTQTLALAMIETREAFADLDGILATNGIDGIFVGPSDLSISWSDGAGVDPNNEELQDVIAQIGRRAPRRGQVRRDLRGQPRGCAAIFEDGLPAGGAQHRPRDPARGRRGHAGAGERLSRSCGPNAGQALRRARKLAKTMMPSGQGPWPDSALMWPASPASTSIEPQALAMSPACS